MIPYIDLHCDTLLSAWRAKQPDLERLPQASVDLERLKKGNCAAQFFAVFLPPRQTLDAQGFADLSDDEYIDQLLAIYCRTLENHPHRIAHAGTAADLRANLDAGKVSGFLTLEDGRAVDGSLEKLEGFYRRGIRLISLTWNGANCFGSPNSTDPAVMAAGLTDFGKEAVERMEQLGMLVDVSHLSDGGFWDVARLCKGPFVASHSNCRALNPHPRSLTDEMLRTLAEHGGVAGLNFAPEFLNGDITCQDSRVEDMVTQLRHRINVGGEDCAALGSDLDGIGGRLEINSSAAMPRLFEALQKAGFTSRLIEKIAFGNAFRVLGDVLK